jgi:hypothetical protein
MSMRTRGSNGEQTSQGGDDIPNPPPVLATLTEAIVALVNTTIAACCVS